MAIRELLKKVDLHKKYYGNFIKNKCDTTDEFSKLTHEDLKNFGIEK